MFLTLEWIFKGFPIFIAPSIYRCMHSFRDPGLKLDFAKNPHEDKLRSK